MVKSVRLWLALAALVACGWWVGGVFFPSEETKVRRVLARLEQRSNLDPKSGSLSRIARANQLADLFDANCVIVIDGLDAGSVTLTGRADLLERALAASGAGVSVGVQFSQTAVRIQEGGTKAVAEVAALIKAGSRQSASLALFQLQLEQHPEGWIINRLETIKGPRM